MFTQAKQVLLIVLLVTLISGCGATATRPTSVKTTDVWKSDPANRSINNEYFTAEISPAPCGQSGCEVFRLTVKNKTNKNLELNWNKHFTSLMVKHPVDSCLEELYTWIGTIPSPRM